jgi:hypothetical protein
VTPRAVHPDNINQVLELLGYEHGQVRRLDIAPVDLYVVREDYSVEQLVITTGESADDNEGDSEFLGWSPPPVAAKKATARKAPAKKAAAKKVTARTKK